MEVQTTSNFPKIRNDGRCHAVLQNGSRCPNVTYIKYYKQDQPVFSKWCHVHSNKCGELNAQYKSSCKGFEKWKCKKKNTSYIFENGKLVSLQTCIQDRLDFEKECLHKSKRDQGHRDFIENLRVKKQKCDQVVNELRPASVSKSTMKQEPGKEEKLFQDLDDIISSFSGSFQIKPGKQEKPTVSIPKKKTIKKKKTTPKQKSTNDDTFLENIFMEATKAAKIGIQEAQSERFTYQMSEKEKEAFKKKKFYEYLRSIGINVSALPKRDLIKYEYQYRDIADLEVKKEIFKKESNMIHDFYLNNLARVNQSLETLENEISAYILNDTDTDRLEKILMEARQETKRLQDKIKSQYDQISMDIHREMKVFLSDYIDQIFDRLKILNDELFEKFQTIKSIIEEQSEEGEESQEE